MTPPPSPSESDRVLLGRIVRAHGLRGEVVVRPATPGSDVLLDLEELELEQDGRARPIRVIRARVQKDTIVLNLEDVVDRTAAEKLAGATLHVQRADLPPPEEGEFYVDDLIGLPLVDPAGRRLGTVTGFIEGGTQSWFEVDVNGETKLVPFTEPLVQIDLDAGHIVVDAPEGLLEGEMY